LRATGKNIVSQRVAPRRAKIADANTKPLRDPDAPDRWTADPWAAHRAHGGGGESVALESWM